MRWSSGVLGMRSERGVKMKALFWDPLGGSWGTRSTRHETSQGRTIENKLCKLSKKRVLIEKKRKKEKEGGVPPGKEVMTG